MFQVRLGSKEHFFYSQEEVEAFRVEQSALLKHELTIGEAVPTMAVSTDPNVKLPAEIDERFRFGRDEWHEVRMLNRALVKLAEFGFTARDLVPLPRPAGRDPFVRYHLQNGESFKEMHNLRELYAEIRKTGEKGLTITRFKGLGEMDPEELWDTTLDPKRRTLLKVTMIDVLQAEKMFRMLMGTEVEGDVGPLLDLLKQCVEALAVDCDRISVTAKLDYRKGHSGALAGKVSSVEKRLGRSLKK